MYINWALQIGLLGSKVDLLMVQICLLDCKLDQLILHITDSIFWLYGISFFTY